MAAPKGHMPWAVAQPPVPDVAAIKAVARGTATEDQQRRAITCIVEQLAGTYDMTFHPDNPRATDFAEGKRSVGRQIVGFLNIDMESYKQASQPKQEQNARFPRK